MARDPVRILAHDHWADAGLCGDLKRLKSAVASEQELAATYERVHRSLAGELQKTESGVRSVPRALLEEHGADGVDAARTEVTVPRARPRIGSNRRRIVAAAAWVASSLAMAAGASLYITSLRNAESDASLCIAAAPETAGETSPVGGGTDSAKRQCGTRARANVVSAAGDDTRYAAPAPVEPRESPIEKVELADAEGPPPALPATDVTLEDDPWAAAAPRKTTRANVPAKAPLKQGSGTAGAEPSSPFEYAVYAPAPPATCGLLSINSIPYSRVVVDGRPLGDTPRVGVPVSPGLHSIVFIHPEHGRKVKHVEVAAGATALAVVTFP
jgi:hypothetical protein